MRLLYDGNCSICRTLAFKITLLTQGKIEILSLHTEQAKQILDRFYPRGWKWDFYVIDNDRCRKGLRSLYSLGSALGASSLVEVLREYGRLKLASKSCADPSSFSDSRRKALKVAALTPLLFGATSVTSSAKAEAPIAPQATGPVVGVAEVGADGVVAYACQDCVRLTAAPLRAESATQRTFDLLDEVSYADYTLPPVLDDKPRVIVGRRNFNLLRDGGIESTVSLTTAAVVHPRYDVSVTVAYDGATTMGGTCRHELPLAVIDYVVVTDAKRRAQDCVGAYADGVTALASLHKEAGRESLAELYVAMASGLSVLGDEANKAIADDLFPKRNKLVITSISELLALTTLPRSLSERLAQAAPQPAPGRGALGPAAAAGLVAEAGGHDAGFQPVTPDAEPGMARQECGFGCCCGCGACLSCGCSAGWCFPPCFCCCSGCAAGCGCGCGYCCGEDMCS
jgi:hypothetical protein